MQPFRYFIYLSCEKIKRKGTLTYCGHFSLLCHAICRLGLLNLALTPVNIPDVSHNSARCSVQNQILVSKIGHESPNLHASVLF